LPMRAQLRIVRSAQGEAKMRLHGKTAIVTGAGSGFGAGIAQQFAAEGATLMVADINLDAAQAIAEPLAATAQHVDVASDSSVAHMIGAAQALWGRIDILVNNAGMAAIGSFNEMEVGTWSKIIQTNLMGMYYVTKEVLPHLIAKNEGDIINVSSTAGLNGNANVSAYSASKFAVIGMSESLMKEVRKNNIRVITLTPSTIESEMTIGLGMLSKGSENVLQPEDFAELILAGLKLPRRAMLKSAALWTTNP